MTSKKSGSRKLKRNSLPKFEAVVYSKIPSDGLIVFSVHYLIEQKIEITLEDIISVCFLLFPHKFGLKRYPRWPDSAPISRHWGDVRRKRYVTANDYLGYRLTSKGFRLVRKVAKALGAAVPKPIIKMHPAQPRKAVVTPVGKTQPTEPVRKVREEKARDGIQKKIALLFQEEKTTPPVPVKKMRSVRAKKVSPAPMKQAQVVIPAAQAKKAQPVQEEKAIPPVLEKKMPSVRAKTVPPAPTPMKPTPKLKATPVTQAKKEQPVNKGKATPHTPVKKVRPVRVKKASPAPMKQALKPEKKAQTIQKTKITPPEPVKKIRRTRTKKTSLVPAFVKQVQKSEIKAQTIQKKKLTSPAPIKKVRPVRVKKVSPAPTQVKQTQKPEIKVPPVKQAEKKQPVQKEKAIQLELIKIHPVRAKKAPSKHERKAQPLPISKPIQSVTPAHPKKRRGDDLTGGASKTQGQVKETKPAKPTISQPVKVEKVQAEPVSKEAKERAGKFTRMMERSDAYIQYKKNGSNSRISEFDFRSLLLCTMESSAETLARNVNLFKGYAGIQHRQDLIVFLTFCEDKFSHLLKPARKAKK